MAPENGDRPIREIIADLLKIIELRLDRVEHAVDRVSAAGSDRYGAIMAQIATLDHTMRTDYASLLAAVKSDIADHGARMHHLETLVDDLLESRKSLVLWAFGILSVLICAGVIALVRLYGRS